MIRAFKYRLWTNANQERELGIALETHRRLYNELLEQRKSRYESDKRLVTGTEQSRWFTQARTTNPYYARVNASSGQQTIRRLDSAYRRFFAGVSGRGEKCGHPRFKPRDRFNSFSMRMCGDRPDGFKLIGNRLRLSHIGTLRVALHRPLVGSIKRLTVLRDCGKWYAVFLCEYPQPIRDIPARPAVGVDVGLEAFLTCSDGRVEENPRLLKEALPRLRVAGRSVARKKLRGSNRRKSVIRLRRIHTRIRNLRREYHHQVACRLVRAYGLVAVERLNVRGMLKNGRLARAIQDAGWFGFLSILRGKAESANVQFVEVDARGTSQQCTCGHEVRKDLSVRWHECPACGLSLHRDHVSAQVILARGLARTEPAGVNVSHETKRPRRSRRATAAK